MPPDTIDASGPSRPGYQTIRYGEHPDQEGDLYLPATPEAPVVVLLHGGFWRHPHGRDQLNAVAADLRDRGHAVWNLEYRRLGGSDARWPRPGEDVLAGVARLGRLPAGLIDPASVTVCGHSAGGHLALWLAAHHGSLASQAGVTIRGVVGQAPITDLVEAHRLGLGRDAVGELMGTSPWLAPGRYAETSPAALLPLGVPQLILQGLADDVVPPALARAYLAAARRTGDTVELRELAGAGHMDFLDPSSAAHAALCAWLATRRSEPQVR